MWTVIKFNKSNLEFLKKDLSRQLGKDLKIYFPRIFIQNYKKNKVINKEFALLHSRLNIIDLSSKSNQPFYDKDLILVFNGEIYNYLELRKDLEKKNLGLFKIRSHLFLDVIFITLSEECQSFEDTHKELFNRWADFKKPLFFQKKDSEFELKVNCNWKLAIENYCESYHLPWVHPDLNTVSKLEDHYNIISKGNFSGQGSKAFEQMRDEKNKMFPSFSNIS